MNANNFGASRSGYNAFISGTGDAVVCMRGFAKSTKFN